MHLLYTRFWTKVMRQIGLVDFEEPIKKLLTQGMVVGESFYSKDRESYVRPDEVEIERDESGKILSAKLGETGGEVKIAVEKMGKSKHNGVEPDEMISIYGADAARLFVMFAAPVENELVWQESGIEGAVRFLHRVWRYVYKWREKIAGASAVAPGEFGDEAKKLRQKTHQTIKKITENFESGQFNTPVAALMELSNELYDFKIEPEEADAGDIYAVSEAVKSLILMLAPYAPHTAEELWEHATGTDAGILTGQNIFPVADETIASSEELEIAVQINGKLRSRVFAPAGSANEELERLAKSDEKIVEYTVGKTIVKVIVVPGRLVNIVVKD